MKIKQDDLFEALKSEKKKQQKSLKGVLKRKSEQLANRRLALKQQIEMSGIHMNSANVGKILFVLCLLINIALTVYLVYRFYDILKYNMFFIVIILLVVWVFIFIVVMFVMWLMFYLTLDLAIFKRKQKLEEVLPDFLQLASSNIRAGMTVDQALWFAVRPRFGVLAKEIEEVAKRTLSGESLDVALRRFVAKYDSKVLERSINILIEGIRAGGEVGELLNKIAGNIQEMNLLKKEMAANVTTYVIFIAFATVIAAPFLFGLASQLITIIQEVFSRVNIAPGTVSGVSIAVSNEVISVADFKKFAVISLMITSFFSAIIISTIRKGNIKAGIRYIPALMTASVVLFFIVVKLFGFFVSGFF